MRRCHIAWLILVPLAVGCATPNTGSAQYFQARHDADDMPSAPPPVARTQGTKLSLAEQQDPYVIFARIIGTEGELWSGNLSMGGTHRAWVKTEIQDVDSKCPAENQRYPTQFHSVQLQVWPNLGRDRLEYRVKANLLRPTESCSENGSKSLGFEVKTELNAGETRVIEGEGGLRVELTRRD